MSDHFEAFLNDVTTNKIKFKLPDIEVKFIENGVTDIVNKIADAVLKDDVFHLEETLEDFEQYGKRYFGFDNITRDPQHKILGQGSFYDCTKLRFPDEIDYLFVISTLHCRTKRGVYCKNGDLDYPPFTFGLVHNAIKSLVKHQKRRFEYKSGSDDEVKGRIWIHDYVEKKGPSSKLEFRYQKCSEWFEVNTIQVDLVPAVEIIDVNMKDIVSAHCMLDDFADYIVEYGRYYFVRRLSFSMAEADFMKNKLSENHRCVFMLLKYFLNGYDDSEKLRSLKPGTGLSSFDIKLIMIGHHCNCLDSSKIGNCFIKVLRVVKRITEEMSRNPDKDRSNYGNNRGNLDYNRCNHGDLRFTVYDRSLHWNDKEENRHLFGLASSNFGVILPSNLFEHYEIDRKLYDWTKDMTNTLCRESLKSYREPSNVIHSIEPVAVTAHRYVSTILLLHIWLGVIRECLDSTRPALIRSLCIYYTSLHFSVVFHPGFNWFYLFPLLLLVLLNYKPYLEDLYDHYALFSLNPLILHVTGACLMVYSVHKIAVISTGMISMHCYDMWVQLSCVPTVSKRCYIPIVVELFIRVCVVYVIYTHLPVGNESLTEIKISWPGCIVLLGILVYLHQVINMLDFQIIPKIRAMLNKFVACLIHIHVFVFLDFISKEHTCVWTIIEGIVLVENLAMLVDFDENSSSDIDVLRPSIREYWQQRRYLINFTTMKSSRCRALIVIILFFVLGRYRSILTCIIATPSYVHLLSFAFGGNAMILWQIN